MCKDCLISKGHHAYHSYRNVWCIHWDIEYNMYLQTIAPHWFPFPRVDNCTESDPREVSSFQPSSGTLLALWLDQEVCSLHAALNIKLYFSRLTDLISVMDNLHYGCEAISSGGRLSEEQYLTDLRPPPIQYSDKTVEPYFICRANLMPPVFLWPHSNGMWQGKIVRSASALQCKIDCIIYTDGQMGQRFM